MSNLEKHKKNLVAGWLEEEEPEFPTQSRGPHALAPAGKAAGRKVRRVLQDAPVAKPEVALNREPAPPAKLREHASPAASPEHLRKANSIPKLRAPFGGKQGAR